MADAPKPTDQKTQLLIIENQIQVYAPKFLEALPAAIPIERFTRVLKMAIQSNPDLLKCSVRSLFLEALKCASDGLLPDGREAALVPYAGNVTYMPMIAGLRKKVRNSREIAVWDVHEVCEADAFDYQLGDNPHIHHKPALKGRGPLVAVYSIAIMKTGEISRDVMNVEEVEKIRAISKARNGPWNVPTFYNEMAKKTVARRHSKVLPMSTDLEDLVRRDDQLYDLESASDKRLDKGRGLSDRLSMLVKGSPGIDDLPDTNAAGMPTDGDGMTIDHDPATGEVTEPKPTVTSGKPKAADDKPATETKKEQKPPPAEDATVADGDKPATASAPKPLDPGLAFQRGKEAAGKGMARKAIPGDYRDESRKVEADAWLAGHDEATSAKGK